MKDPYMLGMRAGLNGESRSTNPYAETDGNHTIWSAGWREGNRRYCESRAA